MASNIVGITAKILQKVGEMTTIKNAYDYEKAITTTDGFPLATVTFKSGEGEFLTTAHNKRRNQFFIRVYQERASTAVGAAGTSKAETVSRAVLDELLTAFDMDTTLSGTVKYAVPVSWDGAYVDRELDTRVLEVVLETVDIVSSL